MAIKQKKTPAKREIDLTGPEGNAYFLLAVADTYSKQLGLDSDAIHKEMTSGDYENLITVFDKHFGDYVDLVR